jgi:hypothetical protein
VSISGQQISGAVLPGGVDHAALTDLNSANYTHLTAVNATDLTDGGETTLHRHPFNGTFLDFAPHNMMTNTAPSPYVASASTVNDSVHDAFMAFDGQSIHRWVTGAGFNTGWLKIDLGAGVYHILSNYSVHIASTDEDVVGRAPKAWMMEGSNDGSTWDVLDTRTNEISWVSLETRNYICAVVATAYRYFRINVTENNGDAYLAISELYLYEGGFNKLLVVDTTDASSSDGSIRTLGGLSVTKKIYTGDIVTSTGFSVGATAGIDATIPIAPVLPNTVAGSATFTKGILVGYTPPS